MGTSFKKGLIEKIKVLKDTLDAEGIAKELKIAPYYAEQLLKDIKEEEKLAEPKEKLEGDFFDEPPQPIKPEILLTPDQEEIILHAWNVDKVDTLKEIVQRVFGAEYDGRTNEAKAIKKFLASRQLKVRPSHNPLTKTERVGLTDEQKEFIKNHVGALSPLEITQSLFNNPNIPPLSAEARSVRHYIEHHLPPSSFRVKVVDGFKEVKKVYAPPRTLEDAVRRVNAFIFDPLDINKLDAREKHNTMALMHYLNVHRFQMIMNEFIDERDREIMESSFIRFTHDKGDLSEEEVDLYINWCMDLVHQMQITRELNQLKVVRDQSLDDKGTPPKALVDQMNKLLEALDQNQKRQKAAQNDLSGKRKDRVDASGRRSANIIQLVEAFKDKKKRDMLVQLAEARKKEVASEIDRIATLDELKVEIFGIDKYDMINGM